jgi:3-hydroxyacyl-CoA dehydrogenase/3-hydroxy-2-methylbutyryl-CoA dehydrogenase
VSKLEEIERGVEAAASWAAEAGKPLGGVICCAGVGVAAKVYSFV